MTANLLFFLLGFGNFEEERNGLVAMEVLRKEEVKEELLRTDITEEEEEGKQALGLNLAAAGQQLYWEMTEREAILGLQNCSVFY